MKIVNIEDIQQWAEEVPLISSKDIKIIYDDNYWDGPLEGVLEWHKKKYYFICYNDPTWECEIKRRYAIIDMTIEQEDEEEYFHQLFLKYIGSHNEYNQE